MRFRWWTAIPALLLIAVVFLGAALFWGAREIRDISIGEVDLQGLADGTYTGEVDAGLIRALVQVQVAGGRITAVTILEHDNGRGQAAEAVAYRVVEEQSLLVDTVSGATLSSKVILKAAERALQAGNNR
jgi:uncharacterized protein with FMN-binding domain